MPKVTITKEGWKCNKCGHIWEQRNNDYKKPFVCPKCKNPRWDVENG